MLHVPIKSWLKLIMMKLKNLGNSRIQFYLHLFCYNNKTMMSSQVRAVTVHATNKYSVSASLWQCLVLLWYVLRFMLCPDSEEDGFVLVDVSSSRSHGERLVYSLHLQMGNINNHELTCEELSQRMYTCMRNAETRLDDNLFLFLLVMSSVSQQVTFM